jgi:hypothetical protein
MSKVKTGPIPRKIVYSRNDSLKFFPIFNYSPFFIGPMTLLTLTLHYAKRTKKRIHLLRIGTLFYFIQHLQHPPLFNQFYLMRPSRHLHITSVQKYL